MNRLRVRLALFCVLLICGSGCVESPASWLPDSAGFLYVHTDEKGQQAVRQYEIAKKTHRQVLKVEGSIVSDIAIHSKGDHFALITRGAKKEHVLRIIDLAGTERHKSGVLDVKQELGSISLQWSPDGQKLLLATDHHHGWYDWRKSELTLKKGGAPWPMLLGSPVRPDGAGVVMRKQSEGYFFMMGEDWERRLKEDLELSVKDKETHRLPRFQWNDKQLNVTVLGSKVLSIDSETGAGVRTGFDVKTQETLELNLAKGPTPLDVVMLQGDQTGLVVSREEGMEPRFQVRVHRPDGYKRKVLLSGCKKALLLPSPDRKYALVIHEKADGKSGILVVDALGEVLDDVPLGRTLDRVVRGASSGTIRAQSADEAPKNVTPAKSEPLHYELAVDTLIVRPTKADGRNWDAFGGYPDLEVNIRNLRSGSAFTTPNAADTLEHTFNVLAGKVNAGDVLEIDVWDVDVCYNDHVGLKRLELTKALLEQEAVELTFGEVSSLKLRFFPVRSTAALKIGPGKKEMPFGDDRIAARFEQLAPSTIGMEQATRTRDKERAIVLIHGLRAEFLSAEKVYRPYFDSWQQPRGSLVSILVDLGDVYGFSYGQNRPLDEVSSHPELLEGIRTLRKRGYKEIVLVGHSAGGVIARQFAEDHPYEGVTQVIQVCSPNAGACLAHGSFALVEKQGPFLKSLIPQERMVNCARRDARMPSHISFACLLGTYGRLGDGALSCYSQWPRDLQEQGIPAFTLAVNHHSGMESTAIARKLVDMISSPPSRWSEEQVQEARRALFE